MNDTKSLSAHHRRELEVESAIAPDVIAERQYATVGRPAAGLKDAWGRDTRDQLKAMGFPGWAIREDYFFPGLHIPMWSPTGQRSAGQFKPAAPVADRNGRKMRYASAKGSSRLDVHPRWSRDRGQDDPTVLPAIRDITLPLWITEGIKKADALTSRDCVTVGLLGVFNWRSTYGTLGDWEDIPLKGREVYLAWDADAITKPEVARAMERLGRWLKHKGAKTVHYLVTPAGVNGQATKGVDDFLAAGGTITELERAAESRPPRAVAVSDYFTDANLAQVLADEVLDGSFIWVAGLESSPWLGWNEHRWAPVTDVTVIEAIRTFVLDRHAEAAGRLAAREADAGDLVDGWRGVLSSARMRAVLGLARGLVERPAAALDSDPDVLNTPAGIVDLRTGMLLPHDPDALCTKMTSGSYRPGLTHPDWTKALQALREDAREWFQVRIGQAATGHPTSDGVIPILRAGGENGKSALTTDGILPALGDYGSVASPKLFQGSKNEHSTEMADLRGRRFVMGEELTEGHSIDVGALKRIADVSRIKARYVRQDNIEFVTSHSLFASSNYRPVVSETDHGTWRRLCLVEFPYRWRKVGEPMEGEYDRPGDPTLKSRILANLGGQHDAIVTWVVEGAMAWYANRDALEAGLADRDVMALPPSVAADTLAWRKEADKLLGFWTEIIEPAPHTEGVLARDLMTAFNEWHTAGGHRPWSKETFVSRFAGHAGTAAARAVKSKTKRMSGVVPRVGPYDVSVPSLPSEAEVWRGIRWRKDSDQG